MIVTANSDKNYVPSDKSGPGGSVRIDEGEGFDNAKVGAQKSSTEVND